jgi:RNA polymerase sigma factor (sigma-70 family)
MACADTRPEDALIDAVQELLDRCQARIRRLLSSYRIPPQDTDDLVQDAILITYLSWGKIANKEAWLLVTLRHKCSVYWRGQRARRYQAVDPEFLEDLAGAQAAPQEREELLRDLERLLARIGERHRLLIEMRFGMGLPPEEVAARIGCNVSSTRKLSCRSLARLQRKAEAIATYRR